MLRPAIATLRTACLLCFVQLCTAAIFSFQGTFGTDDATEVIAFNLLAPMEVTGRTISFVGGTDVFGNAIQGGGFQPVLAVFAGGTGELLALDATGGTTPSD